MNGQIGRDNSNRFSRESALNKMNAEALIDDRVLFIFGIDPHPTGASGEVCSLTCAQRPAVTRGLAWCWQYSSYNRSH
jgi:hypothetical protein